MGVARRVVRKRKESDRRRRSPPGPCHRVPRPPGATVSGTTSYKRFAFRFVILRALALMQNCIDLPAWVRGHVTERVKMQIVVL